MHFLDCFSRFVLVRDPHARSNYTDEFITSTVLDQLRLVNDTSRSSGAFWISWSKFLRFFTSITISTYNEDYYDIRMKDNLLVHLHNMFLPIVFMYQSQYNSLFFSMKFNQLSLEHH